MDINMKYLGKPFLELIKSKRFTNSQSKMWIFTGQTGLGKSFETARTFIPNGFKLGNNLIMLTYPQTEVFDRSNLIQIQNECVKLGISVMVTSDAYEAMEYLDQGQKVFFYSSHKYIIDTNGSKLLDYIENLGVKFGWCVDEPHVWTLSSKENAKDVMGSPRHVYNAIFYNQLCRMASQTPFMIGTTATTNAEHTGLISVAGTMSFEVVNTKPSLGEMLPHSAFLGITQEYQLGSVINPLDTLDIFELALTTHHEKSLRYGLRSMLIKCESLIGSNGWTTEHIIKQVLKPYYMNNPDFYFEDSIVLLTSNFKGYINLIKQGCVTIVEQTSADQSQLIRDLGNPNTPAQICIVVEKGKMGLNVHNFKTYFPFRKTDKKRSSDFNHESIPDSPIQEAGRCGRIYTGIKHSDFVKTWGYDTTEYVKSLKTDEEVSNFIEVNSMDLYHPNTDMWRKAIDVIREEVTPSKSMATAWINRIRNGK